MGVAVGGGGSPFSELCDFLCVMQGHQDCHHMVPEQAPDVGPIEEAASV
jgi:hypothetical protein